MDNIAEPAYINHDYSVDMTDLWSNFKPPGAFLFNLQLLKLIFRLQCHLGNDYQS